MYHSERGKIGQVSLISLWWEQTAAAINTRCSYGRKTAARADVSKGQERSTAISSLDGLHLLIFDHFLIIRALK